MLIDLAPPAAPADGLAALADQLRLPFGFPDDDARRAALAADLQAALRVIEARSGRILLRRRFRLRVAAWSGPRSQELPVGPVAQVESVTVEDANGLRAGADLAAVRLDALARPARVVARPPAALPAIPLDGVGEVEFSAGYGPRLDDAPSDLRRAVVLLAAALHLGDWSLEGPEPAGIAALIEPYRPVRL